MKVVCGHNVDGAAHHHLQGLEGGDHHGQHIGHLDPAGPDPVVGVHQGVHRVVHHHEPSAGRGISNIWIPGEPEHSHVVIPVEEDQLLLPENNKDCVHQLRQLKYVGCESRYEVHTRLWSYLTQNKQPGPQSSHVISLQKAGVADSVVEALLGETGQELRPGSQGSDNAERGEGEAPDCQRLPEAIGLSIFHPMRNSENE